MDICHTPVVGGNTRPNDTCSFPFEYGMVECVSTPALCLTMMEPPGATPILKKGLGAIV